MLRAYKHVKAEFADLFGTGESIQIGTFATFRGGETDRADPYEGRTINYVRSHTINPDGLAPLSPSDSNALRALGQEYLSTVNMSNCEFRNMRAISELSPAYLFCASMEPDFGRVDNGEVIFEISDMMRLGHYLSTQRLDLLGGYICGRVQYESRHRDPFVDGPAYPHPLIKNERFSFEREIRLVFDERRRGNAFERIAARRASKLFRRIAG
jgi:hypothetical protein